MIPGCPSDVSYAKLHDSFRSLRGNDGRARNRGVGPMPGFPPTRHSMIERMRSVDTAARREAFGDLVEGYWKPLYKYLRIHWRVSDDDAQELTQAFFSEAFQKEWLIRYDPDKARFRTFVRLCADRFVMNARQAASRMKRGGAVETVSLDFAGAEREILATAPAAAEPDEFFHQEFVRALFERSLHAVRLEFES